LRKEGGGLFGAKGLLGELAKMQEPPQLPRPAAVVGAPNNSESRAAERRVAKEARVEQILAERAERLGAEALFRNARSSSAPSLHMATRPTLEAVPKPSKEDLDRQKLRVACKMEMLDFFNGYASNVNKMSVDQTKALLHKLHGGMDVANAAYPSTGSYDVASSGQPSPYAGPSPNGSPHEATVAAGGDTFDAGEQDEDAGELFAKWPDEADVGGDQSLQQRLQHVNDLCNRAFDSTLLEEVSF
jgi:hypothetical protein